MFADVRFVASFSGAVIYKVDGGTVWKFVTSIGTTNTVSTSVTTAGGSAYQRLAIKIVPNSSTTALAYPIVDGKQLNIEFFKKLIDFYKVIY